MTEPAAVAIELRGVSYRLPDGRALIEDLSLKINRGEMLIVLGRSGSGKTTSLRLINGLLAPSSGDVLVDGKSLAQWDPIQLRRGMGYVIQEIGLFPHWTVERNIALVPHLEKWPAPRVRERVHELLHLVGMKPEEFAGRFPRQLSGGQRQRVGVARALAADPAILLMDEPFGALDPVTAAELETEFRALTARLNKTIVFVTHNLRSALSSNARIALMAQGKLVGLFSTEEFMRSSHPEVRAFVASLNPGADNCQELPSQGGSL